MPIDPDAAITLTAFDWVPDFARGQVRDLRVRWALEEVGQSYAVRLLPLGSQKAAAHRAIQPFGQIPTFEEGDLTLFESGAIVWHVAERFHGLMPQDPTARARSLEWLFAALNTIEPPITDYSICTIFEAGESWSAPRRRAVEARIAERLGEASARLGDAAWFAGTFAAGDLMMVSVLRALEGTGLLDPYPNLVDYVARGTGRPAFERALADQLAGFTGSPPPGFDEWLAEMEAKKGDLA
ncbi:glutathione S-transferase [Palleronia aestuarii]|uniref:Glutathione S-transferase n=1 Tax=Palleronia aestuarii TaxID=568105 RepID=A0A2W7PZF0_9RHOB|nr:glutathione S-transferase family protein [Palleronia aestuarii]PZX14909.1 glutathione S-transferase [Palleronia aestuarii]